MFVSYPSIYNHNACRERESSDLYTNAVINVINGKKQKVYLIHVSPLQLENRLFGKKLLLMFQELLRSLQYCASHVINNLLIVHLFRNSFRFLKAPC